MRIKLKCLIVLICILLSSACQADDLRFTVFNFDITREHLELFLSDDKGQPFNRFDQLNTWLNKQKRQLLFAMNAGMFHKNFSPVGLLVVNGKQLFPLNLSNDFGNFYLKPNGVFFVDQTKAQIVESSEYPSMASGVRIATQSGPMLLRRGSIHSAFSSTSASRYIRNGVGISGANVYFVISEQPVTFYEMAVFFRDRLHCQDALYLDGAVSSIYSIDLHRNDARADLGPILGIVR